MGNAKLGKTVQVYGTKMDGRTKMNVTAYPISHNISSFLVVRN